MITFRDAIDCEVTVAFSAVTGICIPSIFKKEATNCLIFVGAVNWTISRTEAERIKEAWLKSGNL